MIGKFGGAALAEESGVAKAENTDDRSLLGRLGVNVLLAPPLSDESAELKLVSGAAIEHRFENLALPRLRTGFQNCCWVLWKHLMLTFPTLEDESFCLLTRSGLLTLARMILVHVGPVVMLQNISQSILYDTEGAIAVKGRSGVLD